jgi:outer membrane immunogenic protein
MRTILLIAAASAALISSGASAQDNPTSFRGIRIEGNIGGDRFQSQGVHNDKLGYGGTVGFDGVIGDRIVIGPEGSYWRANDWTENCTSASNGSTCHKSFEEWGAAVRAGVLVTPRALVFAKGGYVSNEQRKRFTAGPGGGSFYDHFRTDGYQVGGGVEYTVTEGRVPAYVNVQYVYSQYNDHTSRQRLMASVGIRFK